MKNSRIGKLLVAVLFVPLVVGAIVARAPRLTRTNAVRQTANGPVPYPPIIKIGSVV